MRPMIRIYLCPFCENELVSIRNLEKKVGELKAGVIGRLSKLHPVFSIFRVESIAETRERSLEESSEVQPAQKRTPPMASGGESIFFPMNHILKLIKRHHY